MNKNERRARVIHSDKRVFQCKILENGLVVDAVALGNLLKSKDSVVVGDWVTIAPIESGNQWAILAMEDRRSEIFRRNIRESKKKITASNVDLLIIVSSVSKPAYKQGVVDRFLIRSVQWGIPAICVFNKMDQYENDPDLLFEADRIKGLGVDSFEISAVHTNDYLPKFLSFGWEALKDRLRGKTAIFLGQSGVGKSQLVSELADNDLVKVSEIGKSGKGAHTTTWCELLDCGDFSLIDSPGIRSFSLDDILKDELLSFFPDIEQVSLQCKFQNCQHDENSSKCAFFDNDNSDRRARGLLRSRLISYMRIRDEVAARPDWQKK